MTFRKEVLLKKLVEMNTRPPKNCLTDANFRVIYALVEITDENGRVPLTKAVALFPGKEEKAAMNRIRQACHHFNKGAKRGGYLFSVVNHHGNRAPLSSGFLEFRDIDQLWENFNLAEIGENHMYISQPAMILDTTQEGDERAS